MKLSTLGEFGLIDSIKKRSFRKASSVLVGIGDDAAALQIAPSSVLLATTDMLLEDVHFDLSYSDFYSVGWKSVAVNLSDIAAMGGSPRFCLTSLGIPPAISVEQIAEFYRGCNVVLRDYGTALVGGDTCASRKGFTVNVVLLGEIEKSKVISRAGAKPGDRIFVTGTLGDSAAGMALLLNKKNKNVKSQPAAKKLIAKHLRPEPRVAWGRMIALSKCANSMIDISDGLSSDLLHICQDSKVGARIIAGNIPLSRSLRGMSEVLGKTPLSFALSGGEDYELLFTVPLAKVRKLYSMPIPVTEIGEVTVSRTMQIVDSQGAERRLKPSGYTHF